MNIEFLKFKKSFNKKDYQINLNMYWKVILFFVFMIIIFSFLYGFNLFLQVNKEPVFSDNNINSQIEDKRKIRIDNILKYFSERETNSLNILNSPSPVVDPSI